MTDIKASSERSLNMSRIKGKDTMPELIVRHFLHSKGIRYRIHDKEIPGHPDIAIKKYRCAVFINGCFWHRHTGCKYAFVPKTNVDFWNDKFEKNRDRDRKINNYLTDQKWKVFTVWECELKHDRDKTLERLYVTIIEHIRNFRQYM